MAGPSAGNVPVTGPSYSEYTAGSVTVSPPTKGDRLTDETPFEVFPANRSHGCASA
jgi:hypothetical protein